MRSEILTSLSIGQRMKMSPGPFVAFLVLDLKSVHICSLGKGLAVLAHLLRRFCAGMLRNISDARDGRGVPVEIRAGVGLGRATPLRQLEDRCHGARSCRALEKLPPA